MIIMPRTIEEIKWAFEEAREAPDVVAMDSAFQELYDRYMEKGI